MLFSLHNYSIKVNWLENFPDGEWKVAGIVNACFILLDLAAYCLRTKRCLTLSIKYCCSTLRWCYRGDLQRRFLTQHIISRLLRHCFEWLRHCSNMAALCCAKNRRCESSRVTSPLEKLLRNTLVFYIIYYAAKSESILVSMSQNSKQKSIN